MNISDEGLRLIKSFEGYHTKQPDGSCVAYLCPAKVPTIGHGLTEGVRIGMRMTAEEAEDALRKEIAKHEAAVNRLVTVEINQNEFDAICSLCYNIGIGALSKSSVLKRLNKGDRAGAAASFALWNKGGGRVLNGLVARRAREAALFMKPTSAPEAPAMPQKVEKAVEPPSRTTVAVGTGGAAVALPNIPAPPDLSGVSAWKGFSSEVGTMLAWIASHPTHAAGVVAVFAAVTFGIPYLRRES